MSRIAEIASVLQTIGEGMLIVCAGVWVIVFLMVWGLWLEAHRNNKSTQERYKQT